MDRPQEIIEIDNFKLGTIRGVGEGSSGSDAPDHTKPTITTDAALEVVIDSRMKLKNTILHPERCIEKVPLTLRKDEKTKGYFDPNVISIGPYHHENPELLQIGKRIKPIIVELYVPSSIERDMLRMKILEIVDVARSCYVEGSTDMYSDKDFAEMMLLDGLFLLALFQEVPRICNYGIRQELFRQLGTHDAFLAIVDITKLVENQLPFQVIELLLSLKSEDTSLTEMFVKYLEFFTSIESKIFKMALSREFIKESDDKRFDSKKLLHFLEFTWLQRNKYSQSIHAHSPLNPGDSGDWFYSFRSISELKAKGIHVRPSSDCDSRNIKFRPFFFFFGLLEIHPIFVSLASIIALSNEVAYEYMPKNPNNHPTVAYVNFLKSLINSTEDVKELRAKNILFSPCINDEEVVRMINDIPTFFIEDFKIYAEVKQRIQKHYDNKAKTCIAELIHKYFSSPWTFIAFLAAIVVLIASVLQTYYAINPRK